jgi:hypothetical protein
LGLLGFTPINGGAGIGRAPDLQGRHIALQGLWDHRCFSEDTDLTIGRTAQQIGLINSHLEVGISHNERDRRTKAPKAAGRDYVHNKAMPALEAPIGKALGTRNGWNILLDPEDMDAQTILFEYPSVLE